MKMQMQMNAYSGDNQLIIWNKAVDVGAVQEGFTLPLQLPFCEEFPIIPASFGNTYTARGVWNGIGDLFTSRIRLCRQQWSRLRRPKS